MAINLSTVSPLHKTGHTSKGDQLKWTTDKIWYKSDYMGYEGLSEVLVSHLLQKSTIQHPFVLYQPIQIEYNNTLYTGCTSTDLKKKKRDQMLIPLEKMYRQFTGESLAIKLSELDGPSERIPFLVGEVERITNLTSFGAYLTAMLEIDAFFLNEDRHTNNIAFLYNDKTQEYALSPLFDQGLCLFADKNNDYPLESPLDTCMKKIEAKPFSFSFDEQLDAAEELYGI